MTSQLPDDMFIENSRLPQQLAEGNASPQPGITIAGGDTGAGRAAGSRTAVILGAMVASVLVAVAGLVAFLFAASAGDGSVAQAPSAPTSEPVDGGYVPLVSAASVYDRYIAMSEDDSIFLIIPRTDEGWDYFRAFMYKITDYKIAESIGGPLDRETTEEMLALEDRFLALEDLELTVDITRADGSRFVHDGKPPVGVASTPAP